jgi:hypothetical protein
MTKYQIGERVSIHENATSGYDCFFCGKPISEKQPRTIVALTINQEIVTVEDLNGLSYFNDWSFPIGSSCVKKFPTESIFVEQE